MELIKKDGWTFSGRESTWAEKTGRKKQGAVLDSPLKPYLRNTGRIMR